MIYIGKTNSTSETTIFYAQIKGKDCSYSWRYLKGANSRLPVTKEKSPFLLRLSHFKPGFDHGCDFDKVEVKLTNIAHNIEMFVFRIEKRIFEIICLLQSNRFLANVLEDLLWCGISSRC